VSALERILVVTMPGVGESFQTVIDEMIHGTEFKRGNQYHAENMTVTQKDLNSSFDQPEN
jgi:hypothetical protein